MIYGEYNYKYFEDKALTLFDKVIKAGCMNVQ